MTQRLSRAAVSDISILADLRMREQGSNSELLSQLAGDTLSMSVAFLPGETLPEADPPPIVALLHNRCRATCLQIGRPFWSTRQLMKLRRYSRFTAG